jgi:hypothetical protein
MIRDAIERTGLRADVIAGHAYAFVQVVFRLNLSMNSNKRSNDFYAGSHGVYSQHRFRLQS